MKTESLPVLLSKLAKLTREITRRSVEKQLIEKKRVPYVKEKIVEFKYEKGSLATKSEYEQIAKEEWNIVDYFRIVEPEIMKEKTFNQVVQQISSTFKVDEGQARFWTSRFTWVVARETLENASEDRITELIFLFFKDLENSPTLWTPSIWLKGIWLVDENLQISENVKFRRPMPSDVEREWETGAPPPFYSFDSFPLDKPTAILEMSINARSQSEVQDELQKLTLALRLFGVGSVECVRTYWRAETILRRGGMNFMMRTNEIYKYPLSETDVPKLKKFIETISPLIPIELVKPGVGQTDYSVIAIQRYNDAILKPEIIESRLSFAIMALESLYLKENEREELEHRLSQRVSRLLSFYGHEPLEIYNRMKRAYDIRSSFVHGSPIPSEKLKDGPELTEKVIEYARLSITLFLQLKSKSDKKTLLNLIDKSLLSQNELAKLEEILKQNCSF